MLVLFVVLFLFFLSFGEYLYKYKEYNVIYLYLFGRKINIKDIKYKIFFMKIDFMVINYIFFYNFM